MCISFGDLLPLTHQVRAGLGLHDAFQEALKDNNGEDIVNDPAVENPPPPQQKYVQSTLEVCSPAVKRVLLASLL